LNYNLFIRPEQEIQPWLAGQPNPSDSNSLVVRDDHMVALMRTVKKVGATNVNALICGESGTGKSTLARLIHRLSPRVQNPLIEVNCGALAETLLESELFGHVRGAFTGAVRDKVGKFERAHGGTLFLDDINSASLGMQTKLLRAIEDGIIERVGGNTPIKVDARIISAANTDLLTEVSNHKFREDLYYRINVVSLDIPPLRQRKSEIPAMIEFFIERYNAIHGKRIRRINEESMEKAMAFHWPGNVRELENAVERAVVLCNANSICLNLNSLSKLRHATGHLCHRSLSNAIDEYEKEILLATLNNFQWDFKKVVDCLKIGRSTLFHKIKKHNIVRL
jgi:transcriptional regulator with PAS, ATPase and Fis domain